MSVSELKALAREHWEKWLPAKVKDLRERNRLEEALHGAASLAQEQINHLKVNRHYQEHEAREVALSQFILLPPEPGAGQPEWERQELDEKEAKYQRNPPPVVAADREREKEEFAELTREYRKGDPSRT